MEAEEKVEEAVCLCCDRLIWWEQGTVDHKPEVGWSDRKGARDTLVCFRALNYRHIPIREDINA